MLSKVGERDKILGFWYISHLTGNSFELVERQYYLAILKSNLVEFPSEELELKLQSIYNPSGKRPCLLTRKLGSTPESIKLPQVASTRH